MVARSGIYKIKNRRHEGQEHYPSLVFEVGTYFQQEQNFFVHVGLFPEGFYFTCRVYKDLKILKERRVCRPIQRNLLLGGKKL